MGDPVFGMGEVREMEENGGSRSTRDQGGIAEHCPSETRPIQGAQRVHSRVRELGVRPESAGHLDSSQKGKTGRG